jgi:septum formation protein
VVAETVVLASASPRRLDLLRTVGLDPVVQPVWVDETPLAGEAALDYVARVARAKATATGAGADGVVVLAADTTVIVDGEILGKPRDEVEAVRMLMMLRGRRHTVATAVTVCAAGELHECLVTTDVHMSELSDDTISWYVATGEPLDKAGGYGIQGGAAAFVTRVEGSYSNVVGLPLAETVELLRHAGVAVMGR